MNQAEVFHGIAGCVTHLYVRNIERHCEAAEAICAFGFETDCYFANRLLRGAQ